MGQHLSHAPYDLATLTFDLVGHGVVCGRVFVFYLCTKFEVRRPSLRKIYDTLSVSALVGLVTLTFDIETSAHYCP